MKRTLATLAFCAAVLVGGSSTEARMTPDVFEARHWLKQRTDDRHFACLHRLWSAESGWRVHNRGPLTRWGRAYGIPQSLPGRKMASAGKDWRSNALTQVRWGLSYVRARYNGACAAWRHFQRASWY